MSDHPETRNIFDSSDERAEAMRELNEKLRRLAERNSQDENFLHGFFCECGCYERAKLTLDDYDALNGKAIYQAGHSPLEKRYGVIIRPARAA